MGDYHERGTPVPGAASAPQARSRVSPPPLATSLASPPPPAPTAPSSCSERERKIMHFTEARTNHAIVYTEFREKGEKKKSDKTA